MHLIPRYRSSVTLFSHQGNIMVFETMQHALRVLGFRWIRERVGRNFYEFSHTEVESVSGARTPVYDRFEYVMRDDFGEPLVASDFAKFRASRRWFCAFDAWNGSGPVPGVHKCNAGAHYCRRIRYVGQRRQAIPDVTEGELGPRGKRSIRNLPDAWDDYYPRNRLDRNWKQFRKNQWRNRPAEYSDQ